MTSTRRSYSQEFKAEAVALATTSDKALYNGSTLLFCVAPIVRLYALAHIGRVSSSLSPDENQRCQMA